MVRILITFLNNFGKLGVSVDDADADAAKKKKKIC